MIGLIGGIGAGKSVVAALLAEDGAFVIDADAVGHALLDQRPVREQIVGRFGTEVLDRSGPVDPLTGEPAQVDRRLLGAIVFADPAALRQLESILHPRMRGTFERAIARTVRRGRARSVVLDAAILLEAGWDTLCDRIVFVDAPRDRRLARLSAGRGWSDETLEKREAAQWSLDRKRGRADVVVVNDDDSGPEALREDVRRLVGALLPPARPGRKPGAGTADPVLGQPTDASRRP